MERSAGNRRSSLANLTQQEKQVFEKRKLKNYMSKKKSDWETDFFQTNLQPFSLKKKLKKSLNNKFNLFFIKTMLIF